MAADIGGHIEMAAGWCAIKKEWRIDERRCAMKMADDGRAPWRCYSCQSSTRNGLIQACMAPIYWPAGKQGPYAPGEGAIGEEAGLP